MAALALAIPACIVTATNASARDELTLVITR